MHSLPGRTAQLLQDVAKRYVAAQAVLAKAEDALAAQMANVGRADVAQDGGVEKLATALVEAGEPRVRPFAAFGADSPSTVKDLAYAREAKVCLDLVASVRSQKAPLAQSLEAAECCPASRRGG